MPILNTIAHLNYLAVLVTTIAGFLVGWLWYSPILFAKPWQREMKITPEFIQATMQKGMAKFFIKSLLYTLVGTFGLAVMVRSHGSLSPVKGAELGAFIGLIIVGARMLNTSVWENRSATLLAINLGHEAALFAIQGAILAAWR